MTTYFNGVATSSINVKKENEEKTDVTKGILNIKNFQGVKTKAEIENLANPENGWWAVASDAGLMVYVSGSWVVLGGNPGIQDDYELKDAVTGNIVKISIAKGRLVVTDTTTESSVEIDLGGITVDPGLLYPEGMYHNTNGNWTAPNKANGHNNGGLISLEYIDSPNQWFEIPNIVSNASFVPQGFGLVDESIIEGKAPSGIQVWSGAAAGGSNSYCVCTLFLCHS